MDRFQYSLVWTPLPIITWFIPIIGHIGIADSSGVIHDFGGSHYVAVNNFTFGQPTKYLKLDPAKARNDWDSAINVTDIKYRRRNHNLITNNCHCHVADALNEMIYDEKSNYNQFSVFLMSLHAQHVDFASFLKQWAVFILLVIFITILLIVAK